MTPHGAAMVFICAKTWRRQSAPHEPTAPQRSRLAMAARVSWLNWSARQGPAEPLAPPCASPRDPRQPRWRETEPRVRQKVVFGISTNRPRSSLIRPGHEANAPSCTRGYLRSPCFAKLPQKRSQPVAWLRLARLNAVGPMSLQSDLIARTP